MNQTRTPSYMVDLERHQVELAFDEKRAQVQGEKHDSDYKNELFLMCFRKWKLSHLLVFSRPGFWIVMFLYGLLYGSCHLSAWHEARTNTNTTVKRPFSSLGHCGRIKYEEFKTSVSGFDMFMMFFLVTYFTSVLRRFWQMYCCTVGAMGRINDIVCLARACAETATETGEDLESVRMFLVDIHRFCALSWVAAICGVTTDYTVQNFLRPFCRSNSIPGANHLDFGLLSREEFNEIQRSLNLNKGGNGLRFFIKSALKAAAMAQKRNILSGNSYLLLSMKIIKLRAAIGTLFDFMEMPINNGYKMLVWTGTYTYLVSLGLQKTLTGFQSNDEGIIVLSSITVTIFVTFNVLGVLTLASELEFPFSKDSLFDQRVTNLVDGTCKSAAFICFKSPVCGTKSGDLDVCGRRDSLLEHEFRLWTPKDTNGKIQ